MLMSESDKMQIKRKGSFLVRRGYRVSTDAYGVTFDNGQMKIAVFYERYENHQDILLMFPNRQSYYLHFFALRIEKMDLRNATPLQMLLAYMDYLERNYDNLMNQEYCEQCMKIVRQDMETLIEVPEYKNNNTGDKKMSNQNNQIETPEDKKKGNFWSLISLICYVSQTLIQIVMVIVTGGLTTLFTEIDNYSEITTGFVETIGVLGYGISSLASIAALVIMIYVRVKYPKNIFGKVLMWVYIALFTMYVIVMVAVIIACGIACNACLEDCQGLARIAIERMMIC